MPITANIASSSFVGIDAANITSGVLPAIRGGTGTGSTTGSGNVVLSTGPTMSNVVVATRLTIGNAAVSEISSGVLALGNANVTTAGLAVPGTLSASRFVGNGFGLSSLNLANVIGAIPVINGGTGTSTSTGTGNLVLSSGPTLSNVTVGSTLNVGNAAVYDAGSGVLAFRSNGANIGNVTSTGLTVSGTISANALSVISSAGDLVMTAVITDTPSLGIGTVPGAGYQLDLSTDSARKLTSTTWTTGSDERIKEHIELANLDQCRDLVDAIPLKRFAWKTSYAPAQDDRHQLGWIAQDVEAAGLAKAVETTNEHGYDDFKSLNTDQLYKVMWGALQKNAREAKELKARINFLSSL
jgi:hypothetical protein